MVPYWRNCWRALCFFACFFVHCSTIISIIFKQIASHFNSVFTNILSILPLAVVINPVSELKEASPETRAEASVVQGTLFVPICTFICRDQLLVLAVFLSCPLERGGSQLERGARGDALSPLYAETHGRLERLSAGAER